MMNQQQANFTNSEKVDQSSLNPKNIYLEIIEKKVNEILKLSILNQDKEIQNLCNMIAIAIKDKLILDKFGYYD